MASKKGQKHVDMTAFLAAIESASNVAEVAEKTGLKQTSILARMSKYRSMGIPVKNFPRGGGARVDVDAALEQLAALRGVNVAEVRKDGKKLKADADKRAADKAATAPTG